MKTKFIPVETYERGDPTLAQRMNNLLEAVRTRAYNLFEERGRMDGYDLEDWLRAEQEAGLLPVHGMEQTPEQVHITLEHEALQNARPKVDAEPNAITVEVTGTDAGMPDLFGRYEFSDPIDLSRVTARLSGRVLEITAEKLRAENTANATSMSVTAAAA